MDRNKIWKMAVILAAIVVIAGSLSKLISRNSLSLTEYVALHADQATDSRDEGEKGTKGQEQSPADTSPSDAPVSTGSEDKASSPATEDDASPTVASESGVDISPLTGAALNGDSCLEQRVTYAEGFYYEPLSQKLRRYITGVSFPVAGETAAAEEADTDTDANAVEPGITLDELCYVHILHYDFDGNPRSGELICNAAIAQDLVEIFRELYRNEYKLDKVLLIDEYNGEEIASMEDDNTFCFRYSAEESSHGAKHAQGLGVDINPLYNPYMAYSQDGAENITPAASSSYADRSASFPYKIDEDDLCYKLFTRYGFTWGGHWNDAKGFCHFQKTPADETLYLNFRPFPLAEPDACK